MHDRRACDGMQCRIRLGACGRFVHVHPRVAIFETRYEPDNSNNCPCDGQQTHYDRHETVKKQKENYILGFGKLDVFQLPEWHFVFHDVRSVQQEAPIQHVGKLGATYLLKDKEAQIASLL